MRRASICLAVLGLLAVAAAPAASAEIPTPTLKFSAKAVPIPGFPGTGNFYGKGADVEAEYLIEGSGYAPTPKNPNGGIPPISKVNFYLPKGTVLNKSGWGVCTEAILKNEGPGKCPKHSAASPQGHVLGEVTIGGEHVPEETSLEAFFGPSGSLLFFTKGNTPVSLEIVSTGTYKKSSGKYSWELETLVPPVPSLPGAPLASVKTIHIKAGAAYKKNGKTYSYGLVPKKGQCPKGGFPVKTEVFFGGEEGGERNFGFPVKEVTAEFKAPCPKH